MGAFYEVLTYVALIVLPIIAFFNGHTLVATKVLYVVGLCIALRGFKRGDAGEFAIGLVILVITVVNIALTFIYNYLK